MGFFGFNLLEALGNFFFFLGGLNFAPIRSSPSLEIWSTPWACVTAPIHILRFAAILFNKHLSLRYPRFLLNYVQSFSRVDHL